MKKDHDGLNRVCFGPSSLTTSNPIFRMISDFFYPNVGGVENHIYMLSINLIRNGHKVIVITHSHPQNRVGIRWLFPSLKVYHLPFKTLVSSATLPNFFTFLPYLRTILLREHISLVHAHASLSSLAHESILHAHLLGVRTVFTDHSLFGFEDAASILTNKLLEATLKNVDAVISVSHTGYHQLSLINR
jgi:phosphatidylinositol N-acetylglucosaminyltransferase subunit A